MRRFPAYAHPPLYVLVVRRLRLSGHCLTWHAELQVLAASPTVSKSPATESHITPCNIGDLDAVSGMKKAFDAAKKVTAGKLLIQGNKRPKHSAFLLPSGA